jgi:hypothetical protein
MIIKMTSILSGILFSFFCVSAQSLLIDMDTASGVQNVLASRDTGNTVPVSIRVSGINTVSSYQFKVSFDTTRFLYVAAQQDFGITGEKNILTKNGGSIIGIAQLQINPPASDTVEFSYSITGNNSATLVSGEGLAGVLYLKSKLTTGGSSVVSVSNGVLSDFDLSVLPISLYDKGIYKIMPSTAIAADKQSLSYNKSTVNEIITLGWNNTLVTFNIPSISLYDSRELTFRLYSLNGKLLANHHIISNGQHLYRLGANDDIGIGNYTGRFLCSVVIGNNRFSRTITVQ